MKTCIKCGEEKPVDGFSFHDKKVGRRRNCCRSCLNKQQAEYVLEYRHPQILGIMPKTGEVSIYCLRKISDSIVFYIGQTKNPQTRVCNHISKNGPDVELLVLKNVPVEDATYWECKMIVEYIELGYSLINKMSGMNQ